MFTLIILSIYKVILNINFRVFENTKIYIYYIKINMSYKILQETWIGPQSLENYKDGVKGDVEDDTCRGSYKSGPCICTQPDSTDSTKGIYKYYDSCSQDGISYNCIAEPGGDEEELSTAWSCYSFPCSN